MPLVRYEPNDLWLEFPYGADYLIALRGETQATKITGLNEKLNEKLDEKLGVRRASILEMIHANPKITVTDLASRLGISRTAVDKNIQLLKANGWLERIGPAKGGHWKVTKQTRK